MKDKYMIAYELCKKQYEQNTIGDYLKYKILFIKITLFLLEHINPKNIENIYNKKHDEDYFNELLNKYNYDKYENK